MYRIVKIGGNDYKFEYTIEASLYKDFVDDVVRYIKSKMSLALKIEKTKDQMNVEEMESVLEDVVCGETSYVPKLAITGFYAGLMENHNINYEQAKDLYKQYLSEYNKTATDVFREIMKWVEEDNFFMAIGLDLKTMEKSLTELNNPKPIKKPSKKK